MSFKVQIVNQINKANSMNAVARHY